MIKVLFNDQCSICSKEINHYKNIKNKQINWVDINNSNLAVKISGKTYKQLLRRLHVIDEETIYIGVKAFIRMWKDIPRYSWLSKVIALPIIYQISFVLYELIALILYIKNYHQLHEKN
tara:strand:+ start:513 stop:869 length:357 start_codon:yes stop_codon:yes gene_type:complete